MAAIRCCHHCVSPERYPGCHAECEKYLIEKLADEKAKEEYRKKNIANTYLPKTNGTMR